MLDSWSSLLGRQDVIKPFKRRYFWPLIKKNSSCHYGVYRGTRIDSSRGFEIQRASGTIYLRFK